MSPKNTLRTALLAVVLLAATTLAVASGSGTAVGDENPDPPDTGTDVNVPVPPAPGAPAASADPEAVQSANSEATYYAALAFLSLAGPDTHTLNITGSFTLTGIGGDPTYTGDGPLVVNGNGNTIDADNTAVRILFNNTTESLTVNDITMINGETGDDGGAIYSRGDVTINDSVFNGNFADDDGGAVHVTGASLTVNRSSFDDNEADDEGGALRQKDAGAVNITDSTFTNNVADGGGGGAIEVNGEAPLTVTGSTFENNSADEEGGAIETSLGTVSISTSTFSGNQSEEDGGAIDANIGATVTDSTFDDNQTGGDGGAIDTSDEEDAPLDISGSTFVANTSESDGGAIEAETDLTVVNSTITGNRGAGVAHSEDGDITFRHVTFVDNTTVEIEGTSPDIGTISTDTEGGGTFTSFGGAYARNAPNTCAGDIATTVSEGYNHADDDSCGFTEPSDLENGPDPQVEVLGSFGGPTPTRPPALPDSPLIDAIPVADCYPGIVDDQRHLPRPEDGNDDGVNGCDIGAVEVQAPEEEPPPDTEPDDDATDGPVDAAPPFTG